MATLAELIVQGIIVIGGGTAAGAGINGFFSRRVTRATVAKTTAETGKTVAEVTSVGAGTAAVQVDTAMDLLREMRTDMTTMRAKLESLEGWKATHERLLDAHTRWDETVYSVLRERDITIDPPPPLRAT
jgi:hypothetical protein